MAASLHHPAFVKVHVIEETGDGQFIVMELIPGRTLKQVLADGKPSLDSALDWTRQVAEAMQDAHASGLIHGDLKPSNIMLEPSGKVRILDFGLALRQDMLATTTVTQSEPQGTIAYMAPERLLGALPDARGDIYSLGAMLYEMTVGRRPFSTLNGLALAAAHIQSSSDSWDYPEELPPPLIAFVRALTARQAEFRVSKMSEVIRRSDELSNLAHRPAEPVFWRSRTEQLRSLIRRHKTWVLSITFALAASFALYIAPDIRGEVSSKDIFTSYSEATEMERGLSSLKFYDRPDQLKQAKKHFNNILERNPNNAAAVAGMSLADNLRYTSDSKDEIWLQKADASAQQALKLDGQLALAHIAYGSVLDRKGRYGDALNAYDVALRLDPGNYFAWYGRVESLRHARRYSDALDALSQAISRFPREHVFLDELGVVHFEQGHYPAAEKAFRRSIALQPDAVMAYANLNAVLIHEDRTEEALRVLQQGLQIRPSSMLYSNLGNALFIRGDYTGAADAFQNAVSPTKGSPDSYLDWANLGDTLLWLPGREQEAKRAYQKGRELLARLLDRAPDNVVLVSRMGLYAARVGDAKETARLMKHAVALAPNDANVMFRAGLAFELLGMRSEALDFINGARHLGYPSALIAAEPALLALRRDPAYNSD